MSFFLDLRTLKLNIGTYIETYGLMISQTSFKMIKKPFAILITVKTGSKI